MEGTQSPSGRMLEVTRVFEWSRLAGELMTAAYEYIVPTGRSVRVQSSPAGRTPDGSRADESSEGQRGGSTGA